MATRSSTTTSRSGTTSRSSGARKTSSASAPTREQVAARAYEIWLDSGCQPGRDEQNWLQAETELAKGNGKPKARTRRATVAA